MEGVVDGTEQSTGFHSTRRGDRVLVNNTLLVHRIREVRRFRRVIHGAVIIMSKKGGIVELLHGSIHHFLVHVGMLELTESHEAFASEEDEVEKGDDETESEENGKKNHSHKFGDGRAGVVTQDGSAVHLTAREEEALGALAHGSTILHKAGASVETETIAGGKETGETAPAEGAKTAKGDAVLRAHSAIATFDLVAGTSLETITSGS